MPPEQQHPMSDHDAAYIAERDRVIRLLRPENETTARAVCALVWHAARKRFDRSYTEPAMRNHEAVPADEPDATPTLSTPPPSEGEIGPEWLPPGVSTAQLFRDCNGSVDRRDELWRAWAERTARLAVERERDEANYWAHADCYAKLKDAESRAASATQRLAEVEKELLEADTLLGRIVTVVEGQDPTAEERDDYDIVEAVTSLKAKADTKQDPMLVAVLRGEVAALKRTLAKSQDARIAAESTLSRLRSGDESILDAMREAPSMEAALAAAVSLATLPAPPKPQGAEAGEQTKRERLPFDMDRTRATVYAVWKSHPMDSPTEVLASAILSLIDIQRLPRPAAAQPARGAGPSP